MRRIRARPGQCIVSVCDDDVFEAYAHDGQKVAYQVDKATGLAIPPDAIRPHVGVVIAVEEGTYVRLGQRVLVQRHLGHAFEFEGMSCQEMPLWACGCRAGRVAHLPVRFEGDAPKATPGRIIVELDAPGAEVDGLRILPCRGEGWGEVVDADNAGLHVGDRVKLGIAPTMWEWGQGQKRWASAVLLAGCGCGWRSQGSVLAYVREPPPPQTPA